jgi:isocitrate dehydrogenase (NAD+)
MLTNTMPAITRVISKASVTYGSRQAVTLIPGDGIGAELTASLKHVFEATRVPIDFDEVPVRSASDFVRALDSIKRTRICLKGILLTELTGHVSWNVQMRKLLDLYAGVVRIKSIPGVPTRHTALGPLDLTLIRENTEGEYSGCEHEPVPGVMESLKVTTQFGCERICRFAFDWAVRNNRRKVTCLHKANIMKQTDGLFLQVFRQIALEYTRTGIEINDMIIDNAAMQLVSSPQSFDVILCPNLYGNIVSNICAGLVGGPGFLPGYNLGERYATFEPGARHVARDIEGQNRANPVAFLLSGCHMLRHCGFEEHATAIEHALESVLKGGKLKTGDILGGTASTTDFTAGLISQLHN